MFISESLSSFVLRLRDKSSKARELALELNELQVPHQEAGFDCHHTLAPWHTLPMHVSRPCGRTWKRSASFCVTLLTGQSSLKNGFDLICMPPILHTGSVRMEEGIFKHKSMESIQDIRMQKGHKIEAVSNQSHMQPSFLSGP